MRYWKCTKSESYQFTVGKYYREFEDGSFEDDTPLKWPSKHSVDTLTEYAFEEATKEEYDMAAIFTDTIKTGMVVDFNNGDYGIVVRGCHVTNGALEVERDYILALTDDHGTRKAMFISEYDEKGKHRTAPDYDVVRVRRIRVYPDLIEPEKDTEEGRYDTVWERPKVKEMTVAQIEAELGYPIKVIKG